MKNNFFAKYFLPLILLTLPSCGPVASRVVISGAARNAAAEAIVARTTAVEVIVARNAATETASVLETRALRAAAVESTAARIAAADSAAARSAMLEAQASSVTSASGVRGTTNRNLINSQRATKAETAAARAAGSKKVAEQAAVKAVNARKLAEKAADARKAAVKAAEIHALPVDSRIYIIGRLDDTRKWRFWTRKRLNTYFWNIRKNDSYIQHIIKHRIKVQIASPLTHNHLFHSNGMPTVFARELKQLQYAGYTQRGYYLIPPSY